MEKIAPEFEPLRRGFYEDAPARRAAKFAVLLYFKEAALAIFRKSKGQLRFGGTQLLPDLNEIEETTDSGMNHGTILPYFIYAGGSAGLHQHETGDALDDALPADGRAFRDGTEDIPSAGTCHIYKKGAYHRGIDTHSEDLILRAAVVERGPPARRADGYALSVKAYRSFCGAP